MDGQAPRTRHELEAGLLERAAKDEAFRRALVADPRGTLERELGVRVPQEIALTMVEESPTSRHLVLPPRPASGDRALDDAELDAAAGGYNMTRCLEMTSIVRAC